LQPLFVSSSRSEYDVMLANIQRHDISPNVTANFLKND
jgi:hypothetical protein